MSRPPRPVALPRLVRTPRTRSPYGTAPGRAAAARYETDGALALAPRPRPAAAAPGAPGGGAAGATGSLPGPRRLRALGQAVAEVLAGVRPAATVADRFTERAYAELVRAGRMLRARRPPHAGRPHVSTPREGVIEMCLIVHCGDRTHGLALRLERRGVRWLCTEWETA
ncbi:MAG: Rv3235 family protein [Actinomycetes bacterium]|jgi:hypothetical protein